MPTMTSYIHDGAIAGFSVLMAIAAFEDFRRFIIPNLLTAGLCLLWPLYFVAAPSLAGGLWSLGCAAGVFVVGAILFGRGYLGGGDEKLRGAAALGPGPAGTPGLLLLTGILGGALALFLLIPLGASIAATARIALSRNLATTEA